MPRYGDSYMASFPDSGVWYNSWLYTPGRSITTVTQQNNTQIHDPRAYEDRIIQLKGSVPTKTFKPDVASQDEPPIHLYICF